MQLAMPVSGLWYFEDFLYLLDKPPIAAEVLSFLKQGHLSIWTEYELLQIEKSTIRSTPDTLCTPLSFPYKKHIWVSD